MSELVGNRLIFEVKDLTSLVKSNINSGSISKINPIYHVKYENQSDFFFTINYCDDVPRIHFTYHGTNPSGKFIGYTFNSEKIMFSENTAEDADIFFPLVNINEKRVIEEITLTLQETKIGFFKNGEIISFRDLLSLSEFVESLNHACNFIYELELLEKKRIFFQVISIDRESLTLLLTHEENPKNGKEFRENVHLIKLKDCSICNDIPQLLEGVRG